MELKTITIDGVQINPDELSDKGKLIVGRLHRLTDEKNHLLIQLQEKDIVLKAFQNELISEYQSDSPSATPNKSD